MKLYVLDDGHWVDPGRVAGGQPNRHYLMYIHGEEIGSNAKELRKQYVGLTIP